MAEELLGKFRCVVLTPRATLLDCKTHSVILPAHDGQMGVWRNHMPMLCKLGLGIMEVRALVTDKEQTPQNARFLIDGGFAQVDTMVITVLAYDVTESEQTDIAVAEKMLEEANKLPGGDAEAWRRRQHYIKKASLLLEMAQVTSKLENKHGIPS